ncbi:unnamed protein product [Adineta ricciae]|uniref:Nuclear receptor n=1 Tax=Adineta ricciae TaxID=249248 RepID=A0A815AE94_ADIRI|nr:unnamed protein product [Adineta ricciae]
MATEKKLIYITSDEQLVHEVSLKRSKNTYIVDLDTGEPISATVSKHSSTSDRNNQQSKRSRKSITNSRCVICGDHAIGYNYDVLSCASCKAFFYGHAYENLERLKCLTGKKECVIDYQINRRCFRCRLNKCFSMGMRKDFILNRQQTKKTSNEEFDNIQTALLSMNENVAANNIEDFDIIQNVQSLFLFYFENQFDHLPETFDLSDNVSAIISWAQHDSEIALQTIRFFRQITEFENLHADDRFILIKYNLFPLMLIRKSYNYRPTILRNAVEIQQEEERATRAQILFQMSNDLISRSNLLTLVIIQFTEHDPILLSLLLVIGLFSPTLSLNLDEPIFKDSLSIYRAQAIYTKILWNYLIMKQSEAKAQQKFVQLMEILLRIQLANVTARKFLHDQITTTNTVDRITALMQTILQIS